jgi:putative ABC transport system permease protein
MLLKPLDYRDPDRLVRVSVTVPLRNQQDVPFSLIEFGEFRKTARSFTEFGAFGPAENIGADHGHGSAEGPRVSSNFLSILGVEPILGRSFLPEEDTRGRQGRHSRFHPVHQSSACCQRVLHFPSPGPACGVTRPSEWSALPSRYWSNVTLLTGFARLKPQVTLEQARIELNVLHRQYAAAYPRRGVFDPAASVRVVWMRDQLVANVRPMPWMLFGAVGFVLLIACANVASLLLARAASRSREFAVRAALGAARGRLIRQLLAESLVLATLGGALGVLLAQWGLRAITRVTALPLPRAGDIRLDGMVLAFTLALSIATGVLFGLFPSLAMSRPDLADVLRESGAAAGRGLSARQSLLGISARGLLVVVQVALSIVLLIGAALLMQSFARLHSVNPGFFSPRIC